MSFKRNIFRATLTKIHRIKINHSWIQISYSSPYEAHLKKTHTQRVAWVKKEKIQWNCKGFTFKNHRNCSLSISMKGSLFIKLFGYSCNFNFSSVAYTDPRRWAVPVTLKKYLLWFHCIFLIFDISNLWCFFSQMWFIRSIRPIGQLYPKYAWFLSGGF